MVTDFCYLFERKTDFVTFCLLSGNKVAIPPSDHVHKTYLPDSLSEPSLRLKSFFIFSNLAVLTAKSQNKEGFSTSEKARITRLPALYENDMYNCTSVNLSLPGEKSVTCTLPSELPTIHLTAG